MNVRPNAWRRAFASPQVILSLLALLGAVVAVFLSRPKPVEVPPFELPVSETIPTTSTEVRVITFDRFNLEIPLLVTLDMPESVQGRIAVLVDAVREQLEGENGAWPDWLPEPVVFVTELSGQRTVVLDFPVDPSEARFETEAFGRLRRSLEATLAGDGHSTVVLLIGGLPPQLPVTQPDPV